MKRVPRSPGSLTFNTIQKLEFRNEKASCEEPAADWLKCWGCAAGRLAVIRSVF
jgi:hypothetical protein